MKTLVNKILAWAPVLALMVSCSKADDQVLSAGKERVVHVVAENVDTRTMIDYERSDYSHLVWEEADRLAVLTDVYDDVASIVEVNQGAFDARIPADYNQSYNNLIAIYPSDGLDGQNIDKITMPIPAEQHQDTLGSSRGVQVPMFTVVKVPNGVTEQTVSARYQFPAATLRFAIRSDVHKQEKVLSVTMTAPDPIAGKMTFNRPSYSVRLIKGEKEVTVTVDKPAAIEKGGYLYMNVMRGVYEGVTIKVTTDQNTYLFENGRFDLTDPEASLFKVNLPLDVSVVKPKPSYYTEISEGEVFSADEKYLIAYKYSDTEYYVASEFVDYYLYYESFEVGENGLEATDRLTQYAFTFTPVEGTEYVTLYSDAVSNSSPSAMYGKGFVGSPTTTYTDPGKFVRGSQEDVDSPDTHLRYCWKVTFEDGAPQINSVLVDGYRIAFERWGQLFTPCKLSNTDSYPIVILKLTK